MKATILILGLFLSLSVPAHECLTRTHVFLIHGVGGRKTAFGVMDKYLEKINPCIKAEAFEYETGKSAEVSTVDFADKFDAFVKSYVLENQVPVTDKISLIMHSQGGIVGSLWLKKIKHERPEIYAKVDSFITLSTPFWGSTMAIVGKRFFYTSPSGTHNPISRFGRTELREMSFGSQTIKSMQDSFDDIFTGSHIRFLAIGGLKRDYTPEYGEDDTVVSVYSSRPDHYWMRDKIDLKEDDLQPEYKFEKTNSVPFVPVTATHFQVEIPGVAKVNESCLTKKECTHPSISHIIRHLNGETPMTEFPSFPFQKFRVQIYLRGWEGLIEDSQEVVLTVHREQGAKEDHFFSVKRGGVLHTTFADLLKTEGEGVISMQLKIRGKVVREYNTPVAGGFSTFLNLELVR